MNFTHLTILLGALALAACSSSSDSNSTGSGGSGGSSSSTTSSPSTTSKDIVAANGGTVALKDGAGVVIPAGALADDTTITIKSKTPAASLPSVDTIQGLTYDLGPNGTTFKKPVALTLPLSATPGANEQAVISWLNTDTNKWEDLTTTTAKGEVTAETTHFTMFVVRFAGVAADAVTCDFAACTGGDIVGNWTIQGACIDFPNPYEAICADATFDFQTEFTGSINFKADGSYTSSIATGGTINFTFPASCLVDLTGGQMASCQDLFGSNASDGGSGGTTCTGDSSTGCDCTSTTTAETQDNSGTYTTSGSTLTTVDADSKSSTSDICISGNTLKAQGMENSDQDGGTATTITWTAARQ